MAKNINAGYILINVGLLTDKYKRCMNECDIIVNATAIDSSGALSILRQFLANIPASGYHWLVFVSDKISVQAPSPNVRIVPVSGVKPMLRRFWWDVFGLNRWLKRHHIEPIATVSLQNTGFRVAKKHIPKFIYYHQALLIYPYSWNPLKKDERTLWFYKHIYPFFIRLFLSKDTIVFVQLDYIKAGFARFFNHPEQNIHVYTPSVVAPEAPCTQIDAILDPKKINLFYPAINVFYKNHKVLKDALRYTSNKEQLYFTWDKPSGKEEAEPITYVGTLPYADVFAMYRTCDALVFPSYIESFGLPLIEAAMVGLPILAADLPYSREVLGGYEGVVFLPYDRPEAWAEAMDRLEKGKRYRPLDISERPGWPALFRDIVDAI